MVNIRASLTIRSSGMLREYPAEPNICSASLVTLIAISEEKILACAASSMSGKPGTSGATCPELPELELAAL